MGGVDNNRCASNPHNVRRVIISVYQKIVKRNVRPPLVDYCTTVRHCSRRYAKALNCRNNCVAATTDRVTIELPRLRKNPDKLLLTSSRVDRTTKYTRISCGRSSGYSFWPTRPYDIPSISAKSGLSPRFRRRFIKICFSRDKIYIHICVGKGNETRRNKRYGTGILFFSNPVQVKRIFKYRPI